MKALIESIKLVDWWLNGISPEQYTDKNRAGLRFDLDSLLDWHDGQGALSRDIVDFYVQAIREIYTTKPVGLLAILHSQDDFDRMGITPLAGMISWQNLHGVGIPYLLVEPRNAYNPIKTGETQREKYLKGCGVVIVTDQVTNSDCILSATRILKAYGAEEVSSVVSLVTGSDCADFLKSQGIDLLFSHEIRIEDSELKFNPNQRLLTLTT